MAIKGDLEKGLPIDIGRWGNAPQSKLDNLRLRPYLLTDPEDLVHLDWSEEWRS